MKLVELTRVWAAAKKRYDEAKADLEKAHDRVLEAGAPIGYEDAYLEIGETSTVKGYGRVDVVDDRRLARVLKQEQLLEDAFDRRPAIAVVRGFALKNKNVARTLEAITLKTPRFLRAKG